MDLLLSATIKQNILHLQLRKLLEIYLNQELKVIRKFRFFITKWQQSYFTEIKFIWALLSLLYSPSKLDDVLFLSLLLGFKFRKTIRWSCWNTESH